MPAYAADPDPRTVLNSGEAAAVIPLTRPSHGRRVLPHGTRGWRDTMAPTHEPPSGRPDDALTLFAATIETSLLETGHSLSDPDTEAVYVRTLDLCRRALEGSAATGLITDRQLADLTGILDGMLQAPRLV